MLRWLRWCFAHHLVDELHIELDVFFRAGRKKVPFLLTGYAKFIVVRHDRFSNYIKPGLVGAKSQHYQVSVGPIEAMAHVRGVAFLLPLISNKLKHFMLAFSWDRCIAKHYYQLLEERVVVKPIIDVVLERI